MSPDLEGTYWDFAEQSLPWLCAANDMLDAVDAKRTEIHARAREEGAARGRRR